MNAVKEAPRTKTANEPCQMKEGTPRVTEKPPAHPTPMGLVRGLATELDRLFEDFGMETGWVMPRLFGRGGVLHREPFLTPAGWAPRIDVLERDGQFVVRADLPGLNKEDVKVEVRQDRITLEGERKEEKTEEREGYHYGECRYGAFYRAIPLPEGVDTTKATAEFRKGVLEVVMPRTNPKGPAARRLEVVETN